ncbi:MAG: hypothetical protein KDA25_01550 [Phycisphaerales bacterium]|nr:hypothetical protein [Phycisphaerales bacterium]
MKLLLKLVAVLVVLLIVAVVGAFFFIDAIAKSAIERGGTFALGVDTTLDRADVGVFDGRFAMSGLTVANPGGFSAPHFLRLGDGGVAVTLASLREDIIELPTLALGDLDVNIQQTGAKANYKVIVDHLKRFEGGGAGDPKPKPNPDADGARFIVRTVSIRDVKVHVDAAPKGLPTPVKLTIPISTIELRDIGTESDRGVLLGELADIIVKAVLAAVIEQGGDLLPATLLNDLSGALSQLSSLGDVGVEMVSTMTAEARQAVETALGDVARQIENVGDVGKAVQGVGDELGKIGKEGEKALKGVGDLIGGAGKKKGG